MILLPQNMQALQTYSGVSWFVLVFGVSLQRHLTRRQKTKGGNQAEAETVTGALKQDPREANVLKDRI